MAHKRQKKLENKEKSKQKILEGFHVNLIRQRAELRRQILNMDELIEAIEWKLT